jgi:starch phosphorylase
LDSRGQILVGETIDMEYCCPEAISNNGKAHKFVASLRYSSTGKRGISIRVMPNHEDLASPFQTGLIVWAD